MKFQRWESFNKISKKYERWIRIYMIRMVNEFQIQDGGDNVFDRQGCGSYRVGRRKGGKFQSSVRPSRKRYALLPPT